MVGSTCAALVGRSPLFWGVVDPIVRVATDNRVAGMDILSGCGGSALALHPVVETILYAERNPGRAAVLVAFVGR
eukprot:7877315-Lingulodinium_polyedra.AAC.1